MWLVLIYEYNQIMLFNILAEIKPQKKKKFYGLQKI